VEPQRLVDFLLETQTGWFVSLVLTPHSQAILKRIVPPAHPEVHAHHMTMAYKPALHRLEHFHEKAGERLRIKVVGLAQDDRGQAVLVNGPSDNQYPHVTISCADGVEAKYSNELLARGAKKIKPFWLDGVVTIEPLDSTPA
jgi:hypothetical protein